MTLQPLADAYVDRLLGRWGRFDHLDIEQHGVSSQPVPPITSQDYVPWIQSSRPPVPEWDIDEIVRARSVLFLMDEDCPLAAETLRAHYRDSQPREADTVRWARFRFWRLL